MRLIAMDLFLEKDKELDLLYRLIYLIKINKNNKN